MTISNKTKLEDAADQLIELLQARLRAKDILATDMKLLLCLLAKRERSRNVTGENEQPKKGHQSWQDVYIPFDDVK